MNGFVGPTTLGTTLGTTLSNHERSNAVCYDASDAFKDLKVGVDSLVTTIESIERY